MQADFTLVPGLFPTPAAPASNPKIRLSIILPSFNERGSIEHVIRQLLVLRQLFSLEVLVVDDDSPDGTAELVRQLARLEPSVKLIRRVGRSGLASAIKEGLLNATGDVALVMDSDGQHEPASVQRAVTTLLEGKWDLVIGSRFHPEAEIQGLSNRRELGSSWANASARLSLPSVYAELSDYMSGFFCITTRSHIAVTEGS